MHLLFPFDRAVIHHKRLALRFGFDCKLLSKRQRFARFKGCKIVGCLAPQEKNFAAMMTWLAESAAVANPA